MNSISPSKLTTNSSKKKAFPEELWCQPIFWKSVPVYGVSNTDNKVGFTVYYFQSRVIDE